jgi:hypothetical protein
MRWSRKQRRQHTIAVQQCRQQKAEDALQYFDPNQRAVIERARMKAANERQENSG